MKQLLRALHAELLKMKRTLALWLTLVAPVVVVGLQLIIALSRRDYYTVNPPENAWVELALQTMLMWALLMLPLFVTLETALIAQVEHGSKQYKHLFALPIARGAIYAAKQVSGMVLIGISDALLVVLTVVAGYILKRLLPGVGFEAPLPLTDLLAFTLALYLSSWLLISILTWVAQRWGNFVIASAVGIAMTIIGVVVIQSKYAGFYPTTMPVLVANGFNDALRPLNILDENVRPWLELLVGSVGGLLFAWVAGWRFTRRDVLS